MSVRALSFFPLAAIACGLQLGGSTRGSDTGSVSFDYASGDCLLGCSIVPMMLGTTESVVAQLPSVVPAASVTVDDPTIVSVSGPSVMCCTSSSCAGGGAITSCPSGQKESLQFQVDALALGSTKIHIMNGAKEIDGIELSVEMPAAIHPTCGGSSTANLTVGGTCAVDWTVHDAAGNKLQASAGVSLTVSDPSVAGISGLFGVEPSVSDASIGSILSTDVQGVATGTTQVIASAPGVMGEFSVDVSGH
jgi:hypothetical protein